MPSYTRSTPDAEPTLKHRTGHPLSDTATPVPVVPKLSGDKPVTKPAPQADKPADNTEG